MIYLYGGNVLRIDLSRREWHSIPSGAFVRDCIGGRGLSARLVHEWMDSPAGKLDEADVVCFSAGALAGTSYPACARTDVMWMSRARRHVGDAGLVGGWAAELKQAGWDAIVLEGSAERPVFVAIRNDMVELRDAGEIWGTTIGETQGAIRRQLDSPDVRIACIGPAGENQVACATVTGDLGPAEGSPGSGAALGAKNCKAIAVRGTRGIRIADPPRFFETSLAMGRALRDTAYFQRVHGSGAHDVPKTWEHRRSGCASCPVSCWDNFRIRGLDGVAVPPEARDELWPELRRRNAGLWYEFVGACQKQGLDPAVMAMSLSSLARLSRLGLLTPRLTGGLSVDFDDAEAIRHMVRATAARTGFGDRIGRGDRAIADCLDSRIPTEARATGLSAEEASDEASRGSDVDEAAPVGDMVGTCRRLARVSDSGLEEYATALSLGLGRAVTTLGLMRAATETAHLERMLEGSFDEAVPSIQPAREAPGAGVAPEEVPRAR